MKRVVVVTVILTLGLLSTAALVGCAPTETRINNFSVGPNPSVVVKDPFILTLPVTFNDPVTVNDPVVSLPLNIPEGFPTCVV